MQKKFKEWLFIVTFLIEFKIANSYYVHVIAEVNNYRYFQQLFPKLTINHSLQKFISEAAAIFCTKLQQ
jgi:hypothetical protein